MSFGMKTYAQQLAEEEEEKQKFLMSRGWRPALGDRCEARFRGRQRFLPCKVVKVHPDDTFDLDYDDGSKEVNVKGELIKRPRHAYDYQLKVKRTEPSVLDLEHNSFEKARPGSKLYEVQSEFQEAPDTKKGFLLGRVMTEFEPYKAFQLPLVQGSTITVISESTPNGWTKGIDEHGQMGFYPTDHVRIIPFSAKVPFHVPKVEEKDLLEITSQL